METFVIVLAVILTIASLLLPLWLRLWWKNFLEPYMKEKAKNLAQKEDLKHLTEEVEKVRTQYSSIIEKFKSNLDRTNAVHRIQFEAEFRAYQDLVKSVRLTQDMFSMIFVTIKSNHFEVRHALEFGNALAEFQKLKMSLQPFIPKEVYDCFLSLALVFIESHRIVNQAYQTRTLSIDGVPWDEETEKINVGVVACNKAIRNRLASIQVEAPITL